MEFILNVLGGIGFNWHVALVNFVNFLILLFILNKFVFKKVLKNIDSRNHLIKKGLDDAEKAEKLLASSTEKSDALLSDARLKSEAIISESVLKAENLSKNIVAKSEKEISDLKSKLKSEISSAKENAEKDLAKNAPDIIMGMMSKAFSENLDKETHDKLLGMLVK
jgi:F-type H+-transporting ATPase subunit b